MYLTVYIIHIVVVAFVLCVFMLDALPYNNRKGTLQEILLHLATDHVPCTYVNMHVFIMISL